MCMLSSIFFDVTLKNPVLTLAKVNNSTFHLNHFITYLQTYLRFDHFEKIINEGNSLILKKDIHLLDHCLAQLRLRFVLYNWHCQISIIIKNIYNITFALNNTQKLQKIMKILGFFQTRLCYVGGGRQYCLVSNNI